MAMGSWKKKELTLSTPLVFDGGVDFGGNHTLLPAGRQNSAQEFASRTVLFDNFVTEIALRNLEVVPVVGGWADILKLLACEDVKGHHVDFGVTVLAGLGSRHLNNLAGAALDHDETVLPEGRALHGESLGRAGVGGGEVVFSIIGHDLPLFTPIDEKRGNRNRRSSRPEGIRFSVDHAASTPLSPPAKRPH